jgi:hypothetical protein
MAAQRCSAARLDRMTWLAHRFALDALRAEKVSWHQGLARALMERGVLTPRCRALWTHTTVAQVVGCIGV